MFDKIVKLLDKFATYSGVQPKSNSTEDMLAAYVKRQVVGSVAKNVLGPKGAAVAKSLNTARNVMKMFGK